MRFSSWIILILIFTFSATYADPVTAPNTLSNGTVADADDVNANFTALVDESNENDIRIGLLEDGKFTTPNISLSNNDAGINNTLFGVGVGGNIASGGRYNSAFGHQALFSNTTGSYNSAFGRSALYQNTTGDFNTASGYQSLYSNTTGSRNTASGYRSLYNTTTGDSNTASGFQALYFNTTGVHNIGSGYQALYSNTTGYNNTASGNYALNSNTTGYNNTASGYRALYSNTTASFSTASGHQALSSNTTGNSNTASGLQALYFNTTGDKNTAIGHNALWLNTTGDKNTAIGYTAGVTSGSGNLSNSTAIGHNARVSTSNTVRIGDTNVNVIGGQVGFSITSDRRLKEDIQSTNLGLEFINDLNPVQYHRINNENDDIELGIVAQELQEALEKHNVTASGMVRQVGHSSMSVRYNDLFAPLIKSVQELSEENTAYVNKIAALEEKVSKIALLTAELAELKALVLASTKPQVVAINNN